MILLSSITIEQLLLPTGKICCDEANRRAKHLQYPAVLPWNNIHTKQLHFHATIAFFFGELAELLLYHDGRTVLSNNPVRYLSNHLHGYVRRILSPLGCLAVSNRFHVFGSTPSPLPRYLRWRFAPLPALTLFCSTRTYRGSGITVQYPRFSDTRDWLTDSWDWWKMFFNSTSDFYRYQSIIDLKEEHSQWRR